ncbi:MAG: biopolymer transporter ExbD [Pseudomonadota bacterium]
MHFPEKRPDQTEERILPLINVVFLLLIFFMIAGSLTVTEPFEVEPPTANNQGEHDPETMLVLIEKKGQLALNNDPVSEAILIEQLRKALEKNTEILITLKADKGLPANQLVRFTQKLNAAGLSKIRLLTKE